MKDEPAFPTPYHPQDGINSLNAKGLTLRDWFATTGPRPDRAMIEMHMSLDRNRNPHNDSHKPPIRSKTEIIAFLRYEYADAMMKARSGNSK